jgi:GNAT superfamily N-acetyltransferase
MLTNPTEPSLVAAIEQNLAAFFRNASCCNAFLLHDEPDMLWTITDVRSWPLFNSILCARLARHSADAAIEAAIQRARSRKVGLMWWVGPSTSPPDLSNRLQAHGFVSAGDVPGMAMDLRKLPPDSIMVEDLRIAEVKDASQLATWSHVCAAGFGMPGDAEAVWLSWFTSLATASDIPIRHYVGWWKGEPVATSTVFFAAGVAGIYNVATLPQARRHGIGAAVIVAPLRDALAAGYQIAILQSSKMGRGVYSRIGFQEHCAFNLYAWSDTA